MRIDAAYVHAFFLFIAGCDCATSHQRRDAGSPDGAMSHDGGPRGDVGPTPHVFCLDGDACRACELPAEDPRCCVDGEPYCTFGEDCLARRVPCPGMGVDGGPSSPDAGPRADAGDPMACGVVGTGCTTTGGPDEVCVPSGVTLIGDDATEATAPAHAAFVSPFWMARTEVTVAAYRMCVAAGVCELPESEWGMSYFRNFENDTKPIAGVSARQMIAYCGWIGARLPTEAEWERAARGDDGRPYPWGTALGCEYANWAGCSSNLEPVGSHPAGASPLGILDLIGNVRELTSDEYSDAGYDGYDPPLGVCDPSFPHRGLPSSSYANRGCAYRRDTDDVDGTLTMMRCEASSRHSGGSASDALGFRCVRDGA